MAHDSFNTRGGEVGFTVNFADGTSLSERDVTWNEIPRDKAIVSAALTHLGGMVDYVRLKGYREFFFSNESYATREGQKNTHAAKILGAVRNDGTVVEARLDFSAGAPKRSQTSYPRESCPFGEDAFRLGVAA